MKNRIILGLMVCLVTFSIMGCGNSKGTTTDTTASGNTGETTETATNNNDTVEYQVSLPEGVSDASIYVEKIEGISDDFIRGVDISSILAEEESGVVYYN